MGQQQYLVEIISSGDNSLGYLYRPDLVNTFTALVTFQDFILPARNTKSLLTRGLKRENSQSLVSM